MRVFVGTLLPNEATKFASAYAVPFFNQLAASRLE